eukprot:3940443-Pyramimonas_sp.AAC.1
MPDHRAITRTHVRTVLGHVCAFFQQCHGASSDSVIPVALPARRAVRVPAPRSREAGPPRGGRVPRGRQAFCRVPSFVVREGRRHASRRSWRVGFAASYCIGRGSEY